MCSAVKLEKTCPLPLVLLPCEEMQPSEFAERILTAKSCQSSMCALRIYSKKDMLLSCKRERK